MIEKRMMRRILLCIGICGFVTLSFGTVLLVLRYRPAYTPIGLVVSGMFQLVFFCHPYARKKTYLSFTIINSVMLFLMISGLANTLYGSAGAGITGILCFSLGVMLCSVQNIMIISLIFTGNKADAKAKETMCEDLKKRIIEELKESPQTDIARITPKPRSYL